MNYREAEQQLKEGDLVFIQIPYYPFMKISEATRSWTNHVGIALKGENGRWMVAESRVPVVSTTSFRRFVGRSKNSRFAIRRYHGGLNVKQLAGLKRAMRQRKGRLYHTGFRLDSERQFCSKFVHEVYREGAGIEIGEVTDFHTLLKSNPKAGLGFWKLWFFGRIPWQRKTITPASLLESGELTKAAGQ